ncbi:hypothetical protein SEA_IAMGROOT_33 [Microbacterium phage IAmGroot]|uniref:Uncharacterized protein n=1 Tax=Microbacterium phage IAmGroot TaxID=2588486 RepID=A0A4Y6E8N1_9CAUD|nr:hypothetical protein SEA_IAMGROOT_33 [Microbacterium phage IAmGroot]
MATTEHPIDRPTEPGLYESYELGPDVQVRVNDSGTADALVARYGTTYETAILDLDFYAECFGPFRSLDAQPDGPDDDDPAPAPAPEGVHEALLNDLPLSTDATDKELAA